MSSKEPGGRRPSIGDARTAVCEFLEVSLPEVRKVSVNKLMRADREGGGWEAEAEVWHPNPTVQMLGIETERPVLDHDNYLVRLDAQLNILGYALKELAEGEE
ncbi:MAG: hypothetical protein ACYC35_23440 [Pirellulales bacterium]